MQLKINKFTRVALIMLFIVLTISISYAAPVISPMPATTIDVNQRFSFTVTATDDDDDADRIVITSPNLPVGATLNQNNGLFVWTPTAANIGQNTITFIATSYDDDDDDDNDSSSSIPQSIIITVRNATTPSINKTNLQSVLTGANTKLNLAVVGTGAGQYSQSSVDTFRSAITTAQSVFNNPTSTQTQVDSAAATLQSAINAFDRSVNRINDANVINKNVLQSTINAANIKLSSAQSGTSVGQYPQSSIDTFRSAIGTAQSVYDSSTSTQIQVNDAINTLQSATNTFDSSRITNQLVNKTVLQSVINVANIKLNSAVAGTGAGQYPQSSIDSFRSSFITAQSVYNNPTSPQSQVDAAVTTLQSAIDTFDSSVNVDKNALQSAINAATTRLNSAVVGTGAGQYSQSSIDSFGSAINSAQSVLNTNGVSQEAVNSATTRLQRAQTTFDSSVIVSPPPEITNLTASNINFNSITLTWRPSAETTIVQLIRDDIVLGNVTGITSYTDSGLESNKTYTYTVIPFSDSLRGNAATFSAITSQATSSSGSSSSGSSSSGSSSSSSGRGSSSSGSGGASTGSSENVSNIILKDIAKVYLNRNMNATYEFKALGNDILSVSFFSLKNSGDITTTIEILKERSRFANTTPEGFIYKYANIWVGTGGFSTSGNLRDGVVRFQVNNSWLEQNNIQPDTVKLQRYNGTAWEILNTSIKGNSADHTIFEANTQGFSPFSITGIQHNSTTTDGNLTSVVADKSIGFGFWIVIMLFLLIGLMAVGYQYIKNQDQEQ